MKLTSGIDSETINSATIVGGTAPKGTNPGEQTRHGQLMGGVGFGDCGNWLFDG